MRPDLLQGVHFLLENPQLRSVFEAVSRSLGSSGHYIAKGLDMDPEVVREALDTLREKQLVSGGPDLKDNFSLADIGFGLLMSGFCRKEAPEPTPAPCPICGQNDAMLNGVCHHTHVAG